MLSDTVSDLFLKLRSDYHGIISLGLYVGTTVEAIDRGDTAVLTLLDLPAAFDTVDHKILLERLRTSFGFDRRALSWFHSYLTDRMQHVHCSGKRSSVCSFICGVPQGSVLGPILFIIYTANLAEIVAEHGLSSHQYADDSQIYGSCLASSTLSSDISRCIDSIASWMCSNRLQLNAINPSKHTKHPSVPSFILRRLND